MKEKNEVIKYYSTISDTYDRIRLGSTKGEMVSGLQIDWFVKKLENLDSLCLEVGCGTGRITRDIIRKVGFLIATDGSPKMIKISKSNMKQRQLENRIEYVLCDASHLPFRDECFDVVVGARIFWHIPDYIRALNEALRVVKINNPVLFDFPCLWGPFSLYSKLRRVKHEVLTEFINREAIRHIFRKAKHLIIRGNTSLPLFFAPDKVLKRKTIRRLIYPFEGFNYGFLKDLFYSYYLIEVIK